MLIACTFDGRGQSAVFSTHNSPPTSAKHHHINMHPWKGPLCHLIIATAQPVYLALRYGVPFGLHQPQLPSPIWLTLTVLSWIWIVTRITIPFFTSPLRNLPSPPEGRFPFGHVRLMTEQPPIKRIPLVCRQVPNDGLIVLWGIFYLYSVVIPTQPNTIMEVLNSHSYDWEKPNLAKRILAKTLGEGLINTEGVPHKAMRRAVAPAFSGRQIRDMVPLFYSKGLAFGDSLVRELKSSPDGSLEMMHQMSRVTLDIIGAAGIGKDFNTIENDDDEFAQYYATITDTRREPLILYALINLLLPAWLIKRLPGTIYAEIARAQENLRISIRKLLAEKKRAMQLKTAEQKDIIATIMRSGDFSEDYLCDQLLTFLAAGHDTTASALTWTTWLLSLHPEMQDRLRRECQEHLGNKPLDQVDANIFDQMPYLTAVCSETLRLYPTVPQTGRHAVVNTTIGTIPISKGTEAMLSPWSINRLPALWGNDADTYNPNRWIEGSAAANGGAPSPYALITFLHGPRSCIGQSFARTEMKCLLAALILRFRFEIADPKKEVKPAGFVTLKPKNGLRLTLHNLKT